MPEPVPDEVVATLRASPAWRRKQELQLVGECLASHATMVDGRPVHLGDDAAAIETDDGYLLLAAEVIYPALVEADPYLAGRAAVLTNVNDVYAMGGRPLALVDVILSRDVEGATALVRGLKDGGTRYGVPVVGGHLTAAGDVDSVAACVLGRASALLSSFTARPGDVLLHVTSLEGRFHERFPFWECSSHRSDEELRRDLELLPAIAEAGWCHAGRDVSMAGLLGSILMLLEPSGVGAVIELKAIPRPVEARGRLLDWLLAFPSYGFVLAVRPEHVIKVRGVFAERRLVCGAIGEVTAERRVVLRDEEREAELWDLAVEPFIGVSLQGR